MDPPERGEKAETSQSLHACLQRFAQTKWRLHLLEGFHLFSHVPVAGHRSIVTQLHCFHLIEKVAKGRKMQSFKNPTFKQLQYFSRCF